MPSPEYFRFNRHCRHGEISHLGFVINHVFTIRRTSKVLYFQFIFIEISWIEYLRFSLVTIHMGKIFHLWFITSRKFYSSMIHVRFICWYLWVEIPSTEYSQFNLVTAKVRKYSVYNSLTVASFGLQWIEKGSFFNF